MTGPMATRLRISVGGAAHELRSLHDWLRRVDELRGRVEPVRAPVGPGEMGGAGEALVVAVGSGGMGAVLAGALSTWISQRRSDVKLTVTREDGRTIELDAKRVDPRAVIEEVRRLLDIDSGDEWM
jgi:hypothetical protein